MADTFETSEILAFVATRRNALRLLGMSGAAVTIAACSSKSSAGSQPLLSVGASTTTGSTSTTAESVTSSTAPRAVDQTTTAGTAGTSALAFTAADFASTATCVALPDKTAGPFPLDRQFDRRDITEGVPGQPLRLGLRVVDAQCEPVKGAAVELWHADSTGDYSAFIDNGGGKDDGPGTTYLRGTQTSNALGITEFLTIVPGWYKGRCVHIHVRVRSAGVTHTSQMFFDLEDLRKVYATSPYQQFGMPDTTNERDNIAGDPKAEGTLLRLRAGATSRGAGRVATLNLGIA